MNFNAFKNEVIAQCAALGVAEYELYYQSAESTSVEVFGHEVNGFVSTQDGGVCFRCLVNGRMGYASTEDLSAAQAKALVVKAMDNAATLETEDPEFLGEGGQEYTPLEQKEFTAPTTEALIKAALDTQEQLYAASPMVIDGCQTQTLSEKLEVAIYNSKGLDLHTEHNIAGVVAVAVVTNGTEMDNDFQIQLGDLDTMDTAQLAKKAADGAVRKLGGDVAPTGQYPVIFDPEAVKGLLGVYSSIFSSEAAQKGLSKLADQEGKTIASPIVTLVDDPAHPQSPMPASFDAEGSPTAKKNIIENGVLTTLLYNLKTANKAGKKTTGNASKAGYAADVAVRPFSMYIAPGEISEEELLKKAGNGVYINSLNGLHAGANPISGDFSLQSAGFMIENGVKTTYVKSFTVAGNFYDLLKNITAVADNVELPSPMGMTNFGSPSIMVEGLSIAGK